MPAGATYKRLHDVIQNVTNFQSGYPSNGYHLYAFDLVKDNQIVTNDDVRYLEHHHYKKNKQSYEERLKDIPTRRKRFEERRLELLKVEVRKPSGLKIDDYLEQHKVIRYNYDFGDDWWFVVRLEDVVDDYYFGFPTLLDGKETAPPEGVGGIDGFDDFLEIYHQPDHPEYKEIKAWADVMFFSEYDPNHINGRLKAINYKKTEWDKINHQHYHVIEDKYRT